VAPFNQLKERSMVIEAAIKMAAENNKYPQWRLCTIITKGGSVISMGESSYRNSPKHNEADGVNCSEHSEIAALRKVSPNRDLKGAIAHVARVSRGGRVSIAKPCRGCQKALREAGVKRVHYTESEDTIKRMKL